MEYLDLAKQLARDAGDILKHYTRREKQVEFKGRANLVTIADKESEALVIRGIQKHYPGHSILAEESGTTESLQSLQGAKIRWVIDPLDGTTNFAHQYPFYCVSIGVEVDGVVACGAVYDPCRDEMFSAARGAGAFMNDEPIRVSDVEKLSHALLLTGFPYDFREQIDTPLGMFRGFLMESQAVRRGGSAALDLCHMAAGRCDGFWEMKLQPWDTAAGRVIAEEAGARFTDFSGGDFSIYKKEILASNGRIHDEMLSVLKFAAS